MNRRIPGVHAGILQLDDNREPIALDSPAWFAWLETEGNRSFTFTHQQTRLTLRREQRSGGRYWYAFRNVDGRTRKRYLGRSSDLSAAALHSAAQELGDPPPADPTLQLPLLETRLHRPTPPADLLARPRLYAQLDAAAGAALTLVIAPAGFGKTSLLAGWIEDRQERDASAPRACWLALDPRDSDPLLFLRYLAAALQTIEPAIGEAALAAIARGEAPEIVLTTLINAISRDLPPAILVLDDCHHIQAPPIHELLALLLAHRPPQLRLIMLSRSEPPLPLARLRARGQLRELRATELRFDPSESKQFLQQPSPQLLTTEQLQLLEQRSEGWAAGLRLATLALHDHPDQAAFINAFAASERLAGEYLAEEVLAHLPPELADFLLRTALLDRFCAGLCAALLHIDQAAAEDRLAEVAQRNLFLVPLDGQRYWFRYHHLFADLLRERAERRLGATERAALHRRAADWYQASGLLEPAIDQLLAGGFTADAADLIAGVSIFSQLHSAIHETIRRWLALLPEEIIRARPRLAMLQAWTLLEMHNLAAGEHWLELAAQLPVEDGRQEAQHATEHGLLDVAMLLFRGDPAQSRAAAEQLRASLPPGNPDLDALLHFLQGIAIFSSGDWQLARAEFLALARQAAATGNQFLNFAAGLCEVCTASALGEIETALATCRRLIGAANQPDDPTMQALLRLLQADLCNECGAPIDLAAIVADLRVTGASDDLDVTLLGALLALRVALTANAGDLARRAIDQVEELNGRARWTWLAAVAATLRAELALHEQDLSAAQNWLTLATPGLTDEMSTRPLVGVYAWEHTATVPIRIGLAQGRASGRTAHFVQALAVLDQLAQAPIQPQRALVKLELLRALALAGLEQREAALSRLREALQLARPAGYCRIFVEEGPTLAGLLRSLSPADSAESRQIAQLLAHFPLENESPALPEALTQREQEVLNLLAEGASNRQIAAQLFLSEGTVKGYVHSILGKLGVRSRSQAAAEARRRGLV